MADPFVAEIRIFPFTFAPKGWAWCDGQLLPLSQNTALFSLLGTTYGGNGKSNFALPDLQGSAPMHPGQGPGLSLYDLGQIGGSDNVTLLQSEIPIHTHAMQAVTAEVADVNTPGPNVNLAYSKNGFGYATAGAVTQFAPQTLTPAGGNLPHNNMMPYLTCYFCIALQGVFPPRS
ncbi:MAG: phage tail protein [Sphingomonadales bacterium]|nr:MAG: phage tail protein [Sphingomonadales bacterium]